MIRLFQRKKIEIREAQPYRLPEHAKVDPKHFNEVMQHQHEMRKQLYRKLKLQ